MTVPAGQPGVAAALSTAQDAGPAGEAERLCRRLAMGADEPVTPPRLLQVGGTGRVWEKSSGSDRGNERSSRRNIHPRFVRLPGRHTLKLIIADEHKGLKGAAAKVLGATIQRCRVHFMRNALACVGKKDRPIVTAALRTAFDQDTLADSKEHWTKLIEAFQPRHPKLAELMLRAEEDVLAYKTFPQAHWRQIHSTNPLERLNKEIKRRTNVVGIFPNEAAIRRLVGALMLEQNDEWAVTRRYMTLETVAAICEDTTMDPAKIAAL